MLKMISLAHFCLWFTVSCKTKQMIFEVKPIFEMVYGFSQGQANVFCLVLHTEPYPFQVLRYSKCDVGRTSTYTNPFLLFFWCALPNPNRNIPGLGDPILLSSDAGLLHSCLPQHSYCMVAASNFLAAGQSPNFQNFP